jgi:hypothetical protein
MGIRSYAIVAVVALMFVRAVVTSASRSRRRCSLAGHCQRQGST